MQTEGSYHISWFTNTMVSSLPSSDDAQFPPPPTQPPACMCCWVHQMFRSFESWGSDKDWSVAFPEGEEAAVVAAGSSVVAVATSKQVSEASSSICNEPLDTHLRIWKLRDSAS